MREIKRIYDSKDTLVSLVYNHMKVAGPKSLSIRTDIPLLNQHQQWNVQEFASVSNYYSQLYTELQAYIESAYQRGINPVSDYLYKGFLDSLTNVDLQMSVRRLHDHYKRPMTAKNAIMLDTAVERNSRGSPPDYFLSVNVFARFGRISADQPLLVVPLAQYRFNIELTKHHSR